MCLFLYLIAASNVLSWSNQCTVLVDEKAEFQTAKSVASNNKTNRPRPTTIISASSTSPSAASPVVAQDEAPSIQQPALSNPGGSGISSSSKDAGGKKVRVVRGVEESLKHENVDGVGFNYFKEIILHGNTSSVVTHPHSNSLNNTITNFSTQDISISTTNHTILQISHEPRENSGNKLTIVCHNNQDINLGKSEATDDDDNEDLIEQDTLIDYSTETTTTIIENDLMSNNGNNNQRLIAKHSKRNSNDNDDIDENLEENLHMLQNDDPRLIAYNDPENVEFISLDDKSPPKSQESSNGPTNVPIMVSAVPLDVQQPSGVPHFVVHDAKTSTMGIETGPRILVNVSIATDHGSGTKTHAVYMLHVMVPSGIDLNPAGSKTEEQEKESEFSPENLILKPIEYAKYPSGRNPNDTPDVSINEIDVGTKSDYKGKSDPFSISSSKKQPTKTTPHSISVDDSNTKLVRKEMSQIENRKTTSSNSSDKHETTVANGNDTQKNNNTLVFDHLGPVIDTNNNENDDDDDDERQLDEVTTQTTDTGFLSSTLSYDDAETVDEEKNEHAENYKNSTMGGGCNCNHTIPYVLILEGEGKYFGIHSFNTKSFSIDANSSN